MGSDDDVSEPGLQDPNSQSPCSGPGILSATPTGASVDQQQGSSIERNPRSKSDLVCMFCGTKFGSRALRDSHARRDHPDEVLASWFGCDLCNFYLPDLASFQGHARNHERLEGNLFTGKPVSVIRAALVDEDRTLDPGPSTSRAASKWTQSQQTGIRILSTESLQQPSSHGTTSSGWPLYHLIHVFPRMRSFITKFEPRNQTDESFKCTYIPTQHKKVS